MKKEITIHEKYGPAMQITTQAEADLYFAECVEHTMGFGSRVREEAESVERGNLGYYAGYHDSETRQRVEKLFRCEHPVFGSIERNGQPTPEAAFSAGVKLAENHPNAGPSP